MTYLIFWHCIVDLLMRQTGAGFRKKTIISFHRKNLIWYLFSYWLVAARNERVGLLSCEVHVAHAVSAFQTKLSTASSVSVQLICDRLCYWLYMIWYSMIQGGNQ